MFKWNSDWSRMLNFSEHISCLGWHDKKFSLKICCAKWIDLIPGGQSASAAPYFKRKKIASSQNSDWVNDLTIFQLQDELQKSKAALHDSCYGPGYVPRSGAQGITAQFLWESPHCASGPQFLSYKTLVMVFPGLLSTCPAHSELFRAACPPLRLTPTVRGS